MHAFVHAYAVHDKRHLLLECLYAHWQGPYYPALFSPAKGSMQLFMWRPDIVGIAQLVMNCFDLLGAPPDAHDDGSWTQAHVHQPWPPGGWIGMSSHTDCEIRAVCPGLGNFPRPGAAPQVDVDADAKSDCIACCSWRSTAYRGKFYSTIQCYHMHVRLHAD